MISKAKLDKWLFWCTPAMSALGRLRQKDHKLKVNLGYTARPCLNEQWPGIYSGFWILNMTQVCTESGFPELAIGMTRSATKGHPSLFWSKDCQAALGVRSYGILRLPLRIKKRPISAFSFFSVSPFFNKFPSYVHSEKLRDYSRMICLNVCGILVKGLLKRERQKEMVGR